MKITTISKVASLVISSVMIQTALAGHEVGIGVGPHFGGGGVFKMSFVGGFHSAPAVGNPSSYPTVTAVQRDLTKLGYYHGSIDGLYGRATRGAVARYQTAHHLAVT